MSLEELPAALSVRRADWIEALNSGDLDTYVDLVSEAVVWFPPGQVPIEGRRAFRQWIAPFLDQYDYEFSVEPLHFQVSGRWMVEQARFRSRMTDRSSGEASSHRGHMVMVWHNEADVRWRIDRYVDLGAQS